MRLRRASQGIRTGRTGPDYAILARLFREGLRLFSERGARDPLKEPVAMGDHFGNARKRGLDL